MNTAPGRRLAPSRWPREWVLGAAIAMLVAQVALRTWAAWSSWYFLDDLVFLRNYAEAADPGYLLEPYNGHLMPAAKGVYWLIGSVGPAAWWPAALFLVVGQALASAACLWMLVSLFGARRAILLPYALYLFLALSVPSYMWFIAALQQLPLQIALSLGVGAWVRHLRAPRPHWLALCVAALLLGLLFWPKALFLLPLLGFLSLGYFSSGGPRARLRNLRGQAASFAVLLAVGIAYVGYYVSVVPGQFTSVTARLVGQFADTMLGTTLASGLVGGPWRWDNPAPPNAFADPPEWAVHLAWVVVLAVMVYVHLRRRRAARALLLFAGYVVGTFLLVLTGRATALGATLGTDSRYLSDVPLIVALCLALACIDLPGAPGSSAVRDAPLIQPAPRALVGVLAAVVLIGAVASSVDYVRPWHENAAKPFFDRLRTEAEVEVVEAAPDPGLDRGRTGGHGHGRVLAAEVADARPPHEVEGIPGERHLPALRGDPPPAAGGRTGKGVDSASDRDLPERAVVSRDGQLRGDVREVHLVRHERCEELKVVGRRRQL